MLYINLTCNCTLKSAEKVTKLYSTFLCFFNTLASTRKSMKNQIGQELNQRLCEAG